MIDMRWILLGCSADFMIKGTPNIRASNNAMKCVMALPGSFKQKFFILLPPFLTVTDSLILLQNLKKIKLQLD